MKCGHDHDQAFALGRTVGGCVGRCADLHRRSCGAVGLCSAAVSGCRASCGSHAAAGGLYQSGTFVRAIRTRANHQPKGCRSGNRFGLQYRTGLGPGSPVLHCRRTLRCSADDGGSSGRTRIVVLRRATRSLRRNVCAQDRVGAGIGVAILCRVRPKPLSLVALLLGLLQRLLHTGGALAGALEFAACGNSHIAKNRDFFDLSTVISTLGKLQDLDDFRSGTAPFA